jgi:2-(1,2-epoxy-1,2-dihydrophenyl)acetyl-CoA isomerase
MGNNGCDGALSDVLYGVSEGIAVITFNRPQALNAMTPNLMIELAKAFDAAEKDDAVRAIVLTGNGRGFCSGADLAATQANPPLDDKGRLDLGLILEQYYNPLILKMRAMPKPIVSAVNGMAAGAGANLGLMADIVIAARSAYFLQAFVNVGLIPDAGGTWILPRLVGAQRAMGMALLGERLSAEKAKEWGLIWDVVDDDQVLSHALSLARRLADGPLAVRHIKHAMYAADGSTLAQSLDLERDMQRICGQSHDFMEGAMAFVQKRKANFKQQ